MRRRFEAAVPVLLVPTPVVRSESQGPHTMERWRGAGLPGTVPPPSIRQQALNQLPQGMTWPVWERCVAALALRVDPSACRR